MRYKMIAVDLDGTLLNRHHGIDDENLAALDTAIRSIDPPKPKKRAKAKKK